MKFQALFAVAAAAFAGSVSAASTETCTSAQQTAAYTTLAGLLSGTDLTTCSTASGYNMLYATALPTDAEKVKMCAASSCHSLIATVISLNPPDCVLSIPTSGANMNVYGLATTFESDCTALTTPAATTATPASTTATPAATTAAPTATGSTSSGSSSTPAPTTATPTVSSGSSDSTKAAC
ncbi:Elicitin-like protein 6 precursor, partial [Globisporangium splendens]